MNIHRCGGDDRDTEAAVSGKLASAVAFGIFYAAHKGRFCRMGDCNDCAALQDRVRNRLLFKKRFMYPPPLNED